MVYISKASTDPGYRSRGFFKRRNPYLKDLAGQKGISRIILETSASEKNEPVVRAHEKCGFEIYDLMTEILPNGWPLIKVVMRLPVDRSDMAVTGHYPPFPARVYQEIFDESS
ncbi:MAG: GNAT family N-acetyltransferase [Candidatus Aureabacteria bacterium]|nr:GNAT family N-acetyltransferase [Candidatus Auribacterota bacterium]